MSNNNKINLPLIRHQLNLVRQQVGYMNGCIYNLYQQVEQLKRFISEIGDQFGVDGLLQITNNYKYNEG